jgi:aromatic ring-cleaving dioxygenase
VFKIVTLTMADHFNEHIRSYDIHTYFFQSWPNSLGEASKLREKLIIDFAKEIEAGKMNVYNIHAKPIGPHPYGMWECDFKSQEMFAKLVPWFQLNHGSLSVLVHPHTGDAVKDHTQHAIWIGQQVPLITDLLKVIP